MRLSAPTISNPIAAVIDSPMNSDDHRHDDPNDFSAIQRINSTTARVTEPLTIAPAHRREFFILDRHRAGQAHPRLITRCEALAAALRASVAPLPGSSELKSSTGSFDEFAQIAGGRRHAAEKLVP